MWDNIKKIFNLKASIPFIMLVIGGALFVICICWEFGTQYPILYKLLEKLGDILLISSLLSFLTNTAEYLGVFKKALEDIVFDYKFLKNRNDIEDVWKNVSKILFRSKFPQISDALLKTIKNNYISDKEVSYYSNYRNVYDIKIDENDSDCFLIQNEISFTLKTDSKDEFIFPMNNWLCCKEESVDDANHPFKKVLINNRPAIISEVLKEYENENEVIHFSCELKLAGSTEYKIKQLLEKRLFYKQDNFLAFRAKWLVNNMTVQLFYPKDISIHFICRGTSEDFSLVKRREGYLEYEYKGLILRRQGYVVILNKFNN